MAGPLAGVKFWISPSTCPVLLRLILTDLGADTIKVERVTAKASGGPPDKSEEIKKAYDPRDRNKRSIASTQSKEGKEIYMKLAAKSDVVVVEGRPGMPERLGLGYQDLSKINPGDLLSYLRFRLRRPYEQVPVSTPIMWL